MRSSLQALQMLRMYKIVSEQFDARLTLQSCRMDLIAESVEKQEKTVSGNAELLHNLLISIENLGDNVKNLQKEMEQWRDPEYLEAEANLERLHDEVPPFILVSAGP